VRTVAAEILDFRFWILDWRELWQSAREGGQHPEHGSAVRRGEPGMAGTACGSQRETKPLHAKTKPIRQVAGCERKALPGSGSRRNSKTNWRLTTWQGFRNEPIYERGAVKRGGADFVSRAFPTSPSPSASVDLAHLRPVRGRTGYATRNTSSEPEAEGDSSLFAGSVRSVSRT
jgi:hypothetical protein